MPDICDDSQQAEAVDVSFTTPVPAGGIEVKGLREIERDRQGQRTAEPTPENPEPDE